MAVMAGVPRSRMVNARTVVSRSCNMRTGVVVKAAAASAPPSSRYTPAEMANFHDIVRKPVLTESTTRALEDSKYTFQVSDSATKNEIRAAVQAIWNVNVTKVNTLNMPLKRKRNTKTQRQYTLKRGKRAVVTLKDGDSIPLFEDGEEEE